MSFEQLLDHARQIQEKAIEAAILDLGGRRNSGQYMQTHRPKIEADFADIPGLFLPFADLPDPSGYDPMIDAMHRAMEKLSAGEITKDPINGTIYPANLAMEGLGGAQEDIQDWHGRAAYEFRDNFLVPHRALATNQFILAAVLKSALEAHREMWAKARDDIDTIAHKTIDALDMMDDCGKNEWSVGFTVLASVAAVAAVPVTAGGSLALTITAVGATSQVAAALAPEDPPANEFSGESPYAVISAMREAITKLVEAIGEKEQQIARALRDTHNCVAGNRDLFVAKRPALAGAPAAFLTGPQGFGTND